MKNNDTPKHSIGGLIDSIGKQNAEIASLSEKLTTYQNRSEILQEWRMLLKPPAPEPRWYWLWLKAA